ncbi:MAG: DUF805 domain-containing protein [Elusimicrobiaceae bacterium]|nr:DUF805 domain-containing protein [Elusimicrobiaceae bacterium]
MKKYINRVFSWNGEAGRKEMIGMSCICLLGPIGLAIALTVLNKVLTFLFEIPSFSSIINVLVFFLFILGVIGFLFVSARRLRNIGWPSFLAFVFLIASFIPFLGQILILLLWVLPAGKNKNPQPYSPTYFSVNIISSLSILLFPVVLLFLLTALAKYFPEKASQFPAVKKELQIQKDLKNQTLNNKYF